MRSQFLIAASIAAVLSFAAHVPAQQNQQDVPDAPQPQKKPAPKVVPPADKASPGTSPDNASSPPPASPPAGKDDNAFPEDVSRSAAKAGQQDGNKPENGGSSSNQSPSTKPAASDANPFPEDVSRDAAKEAGKDPAAPAATKPSLPPGVSSSQSQGSLEGEENKPQVPDPARAQKDTEIGGFYLKSNNYQGALLRFQDASTADPTNVDAIFGLAQAQRMLGKTTEAARNYQLYLDIVPNGPKAKDSMKALKGLQAKK